jgi:subtilisin family serine protease
MGLLSALSAKLRELPSHNLEPVAVAVIDSGVDATHPDLSGRIERAVSIEQFNEEYEVVEATASQNADVYGHGTAVASIIAGMAPNARIVDIRVLDAQNVGSGEALVAGLRYAVQRKMRIINMSLAAKARFMSVLNSLCETAYRQNQLVVAARRNMPLVDDGFPAEFSSCIGVDIGKFLSQFDVKFRKDHAIEFIAHGEEVTVAAAGGGHTTMTGTSFATPAVTGLCALLVGAYPDLFPYDVKSLLRAFAI